MQEPLTFKLDQDPKGRGLRCDADGLFLGGTALLERDSEGHFEARSASTLQKTFERIYGEDADWESRIRSVALVANALNKSDMARATMTAVLMRLPDPGGPIRIADVDGALAKAGFNPEELRNELGRWAREASDEVNSTLTEIGRAEVTTNEAEQDAAVAEGRAIAEGFREYGEFMNRPSIGETPVVPGLSR